MSFYTESSPLPSLRHDVSAYEAMPGLVVLYDEHGYTDAVVRMPRDVVEYVTLMDGARDARFFAEHAARVGRPVSVEEFLDVVNTLEAEFFLDSTRFREHQEEMDRAYNELASRPAIHAGSSYPEDPKELRAMLDDFLGAATLQQNTPPPAAVIAPHIDFRVGGASYGPAYNALRSSTADTFIIFGVSHQMSYDTFMISGKDFETPLGTVPTDCEFIEQYRQNLPFALTRNEIAHKREHSIEFQAVFLRHIFPARDIRIVPILTGSLHEYVEFGNGEAHNDERLTMLYETLGKTATQLGRNVCYIAGADLCHIGHKFGDDTPARPMLPTIREHDTTLLNLIAEPNAEGFMKTLAAIDNTYRVCGVAPIYATLRAAQPVRGQILCYDQWDETEQESAVTYASVALYR